MTTTKACKPSPEIVLLYRRVAEALHAAARENEKLAPAVAVVALDESGSLKTATMLSPSSAKPPPFGVMQVRIDLYCSPDATRPRRHRRWRSSPYRWPCESLARHLASVHGT
jgi:hypothetical protein